MFIDFKKNMITLKEKFIKFEKNIDIIEKSSSILNKLVNFEEYSLRKAKESWAKRNKHEITN